MTTAELSALLPGTLVYHDKRNYYKTYAVVGPTPGCSGWFIFQAVRHGVLLPRVYSRNAADYFPYTTDKQAVLKAVEPEMARRLAIVRSDLNVGLIQEAL